ncbi:hypothetical protein GHT09_008486 [Marmota monax]|uniref:Uncharacterized protein n=1 Tax=Marmota monax TaxID=9995 RepID=A0A834UKQ5_MARMO|nr:hypothetical protein GHT09_008486 [Marmota monax]
MEAGGDLCFSPGSAALVSGVNEALQFVVGVWKRLAPTPFSSLLFSSAPAPEGGGGSTHSRLLRRVPAPSASSRNVDRRRFAESAGGLSPALEGDPGRWAGDPSFPGVLWSETLHLALPSWHSQ